MELGKHLELREKLDQQVSITWKLMPILCYIVIIIISATNYFAFNRVITAFDGYCILYGKAGFGVEEKFELKRYINLLESQWGETNICEFYQCVSCLSFIFSVIWTAFFMICGRGGTSLNGLPQGWRIVVPAFIFNVIYFGISLAAAIVSNKGMAYFCSTFPQDIINNDSCENLDKYLMHDKDVRKYKKQYYNIFNLGVYGNLLLSKISAWAMCALWFLAAVLLILRVCCGADFTLVQVTVYTKEKLNKNPENTQHDQENIEKEAAMPILKLKNNSKAAKNNGKDEKQKETKISTLKLRKTQKV